MAKIMSNACEATAERFENAFDLMIESDMPEANAQAMAQMIGDIGKRKPPFMDKAVSFSLNGMLSGLGTPIANFASMLYKAIQEPINDIVQALISRGEDSDAVSDVFAGWGSAFNNFKAAVAMGRQGFNKGYPLDFNATMAQIAKQTGLASDEVKSRLLKEVLEFKADVFAKQARISREEAMDRIVSSGYLQDKVQIEKELQTYLNESYDYMRNVFTGKWRYLNIPTQITVGIDELGKSFFRTYQIGKMASKLARKNVKANGGSYGDEYNRIMQEALKGTMEGDSTKVLRNMQQNLGEIFGKDKSDAVPYQNVKEFAQRQMFQERLTGAPASVHEFVNNNPGLRFFIPFLKTPWNITKEGLSYFPAAAPILKKVLGPRYKDDIPSLTHKGAYYDLSWEQMAARQMIGGAYFAGVMSMIDSDEITGKPRDAQEAQRWKDAGIPEQSMKVGDKWVEYGRVEPVATVIGLAVELKRVYTDYLNPTLDKDQNEQAMKGLMHVMKANIMQKTFVDGFNSLVNGVFYSDGRGAENLALAMTRPLTPAIMNQVARVMDPYERQSTNFIEKTQQRIPVARELLPQEYGLYGEARERDLGDTLTTFKVGDDNRTELQRAIATYGVEKVRPSAKLRGIGLSNEELAEYRKMTAEAVTPVLERFVNSSSYDRMSAGQRRVAMEKLIDRAKRYPREKFFRKLLQTNKEAAKKFRELEYFKRGIEDKL